MVVAAALDPSAQHAGLDEAESGEEIEAGPIVGADVDIELAQTDVTLCVVADEVQRGASVAMPSVLVGDEQSQFGPVVERVEVEEVYCTDGRSVIVLNDEA